MRTLYFDCFAGASGNMILGALVSLGVDRTELLRQLRLLNISGFELHFSTVDRSGISAVHAEVKIPEEKSHRHLGQIEKIITDSGLSGKIQAHAIAIFRRLAEAEAKVHGIDIEKVHFHEIGAMDAIIDVVGACIGFELLGIEQFACSQIHVGSGFVDMAHGKYPVPPPAVSELLKNTAIYSTEIEGELITPTGAAIIASVCESYGRLPEIQLEQTGYGAGSREYDKFPNALRILIGEADAYSLKSAKDSSRRNVPTEASVLLETNIDDLSPQVLGFVMERAFELGALDCWFTPIQMKKNRPAVLLSVLCAPEQSERLSAMIYSETTTIGIRVREVERQCLEREIVRVETEYGGIDVKIARFSGKIVNSMTEYDQVKRAALENGVAFRIVRDAVLAKISTVDRQSAATG